MNNEQVKDAAQKLKAGQIGVIPTDTIYGISASVSTPDALEKIYSLTNRPHNKPCIVLISEIAQLDTFVSDISEVQKDVLNEFWPGAFSIIIPVSDKFEYLHRGKGSLAFRLPKPEWLRRLISLSGPIVSTSANPSGEPTPSDMKLIKRDLPNFDFYYDGPVGETASRLILLKSDGSFEEIQR